MKPENHQNCTCTFLGYSDVIFMNKQFPAQEWQNPGGEKYFRVFTDPNNEKEDRFIEIFGTGHPVGYDMGVDRKYISTYQLNGGSLVFHVFEYTGVWHCI